MGTSGGSGVDPLAPGALELVTWAGVTTDTTPDFDIDLPSGNGSPLDAEVDDVLRGEYSANGGGSWSAYLTNTLDAGEILGDTITEGGVTPLTGGEYTFRWRLERDSGAHLGPWYTVSSVTVVPQITSSNTASVAENATLSKSLTADESVTWSIVGGADQADFEISGSILRWVSNGTKDYESPDDADTNNTYIVTVRAASVATALTTDQTITVTVTDVVEFTPATATWTDLEQSTSTSNPLTFSGAQIGTADANRIVAVCIFYRGSNSASISGVNIGGSAATQVSGAKSSSTSVNCFTDIWYRAVSTGTTADVEITFSAAPARTAIEVYSIVTTTAAPTSGQNNRADAATAVTKAITVPNGGVAIAFSTNNGATGQTDFTLTNATEDTSGQFLALGGSSAGTSGTIEGTGASVSVTGTIVDGSANIMQISLAAWDA
jgi:hypothetical protein